LETEVLQTLKIKAKELGIPLSKLCRKKLGESSQLDRIENVLTEIKDNLSKEE
jgi:hypothetical protein